jgi:hypothetical protein
MFDLKAFLLSPHSSRLSPLSSLLSPLSSLLLFPSLLPARRRSEGTQEKGAKRKARGERGAKEKDPTRPSPASRLTPLSSLLSPAVSLSPPRQAEQ